MDIKNQKRTKENTHVMVRESVDLSRLRVIRRLVPPVAVAVAALILSGVEALFGVFPFAFALICAQSGFIMASSALIGAVLGASALDGGILIIGMLVGVYALRFASSYVTAKSFTVAKAFREPVMLRLATSVAASAAVSLSLLSGAGSTARVVATTAFALLSIPAFTASFIFAVSHDTKRSLKLAGLMGCLVAAGAALSQLSMPFDMTAVAAFFLSIVVTYKNGPAMGSAAGACLALTGEPMLLPIYILSSFAGALVFDFSKTAAVAAAALCGIGWSLYAGGLSALSRVLPEIIFAASAAAPLISCGLISRTPLFARKNEIYEENEGGDDKISKISDSFEAISKLLYNLSDRMSLPTSEQAERICSASRGKFCSGCILGCPEKEADSFFQSAVQSLSVRGRAGADLAPEALARRCHNIDAILDNINTGARIHAKMSDAGRKTQIFATDYKAVASLLREISSPERDGGRDSEGESALSESLRENGIRFTTVSVYGKRCRRVYVRGLSMPMEAGEEDIRRLAEEALGARLTSPEFSIDGGSISLAMRSKQIIKIDSGKFTSPYPGEKYSGDTAASFTNGEGYAYTLVSDGMGSGREAALTSGISGVYLEKLLSAGCPMKSTLELLNTFICGGENECFTTLDLMEADLYTGRASFIKSGAAPSFLIRDGKVFRLHSKTVPIGIIRALDAEMIKLSLRAGDTVIMMSDGVTGSYEICPWLYDLLQNGDLGSCSPKMVARVIGEAAIKAAEERDDITVVAMKVS